MPHTEINLSSDTQTKPTPAMRRAIANAEVGDEQRGADPTVNALQARVADLLGKEAALFLPSGTMCNLVGIKVHTHPGDVIFADRMAHITRAESGGAAFASGVLVEPIHSERGIFSPAAFDQAFERATALPLPYAPAARLLCVEQTHNFGGGAVWPLAELQAVCGQARERGLALHMDGARLMNAAIAAKTPAMDFAACVDSVWLDFTKGLGAPLGAVIAGSKAYIDEARRYKHLFGGALRQAGIVAAGCLHALDHHIERLQEDHDNAQHLADRLAGIDSIEVRTPRPESNMIYFDVAATGLSSQTFAERLAAAGVLMGAVGDAIRAVTHLDVSRAEIDQAAAIIERLVSEL